MSVHPKKRPLRRKVKGSFKPFKIPGGRKKKRKSKNVGGTTFTQVKKNK